MSGDYAVLVVAKAPVPGLAKTRLCPPATPEQAADLAAAALLDTLDAVLATPGAVPVVAITGDVTAAARRAELTRTLQRCSVLPQRGQDFGARLANAHADTAARLPGLPVVQIGMDTPQVTAVLLGTVAGGLAAGEAVVGPATDGGWWVLALREPRNAAVLAAVPMSRPDTGTLTRAALESVGLRTALAPELRDVDTMTDAEVVAAAAPESRFGTALRLISDRAVAR